MILFSSRLPILSTSIGDFQCLLLILFCITLNNKRIIQGIIRVTNIIKIDRGNENEVRVEVHTKLPARRIRNRPHCLILH